MDEQKARELLVDMEISHQRFQRREALAWLVLCYDSEQIEEHGADAIAGTYGPFPSPEEALVQAGKHDASSMDGFANVVIPLYPPVNWRDEQ